MSTQSSQSVDDVKDIMTDDLGCGKHRTRTIHLMGPNLPFEQNHMETKGDVKGMQVIG